MTASGEQVSMSIDKMEKYGTMEGSATEMCGFGGKTARGKTSFLGDHHGDQRKLTKTSSNAQDF